MSTRIKFTTIVLTMLAVLLMVIPASAQAITQTIIFKDETTVLHDVDVCGAGNVTIIVTYGGVLHTTEFTEDHPNAGTVHGMFRVHATTVTLDLDENVLSEDHSVKTIFHTNINRQNFNNRFNFFIQGKSPDGGHFRYHLDGHFNLSASGNLVEFTNLRISCP